MLQFLQTFEEIVRILGVCFWPDVCYLSGGVCSRCRNSKPSCRKSTESCDSESVSRAQRDCFRANDTRKSLVLEIG